MSFWKSLFNWSRKSSAPVLTPPKEETVPDLIIPKITDDDSAKTKIISVLNVFENDSESPKTEYDKIYLYHDGPGKKLQVTLGRGYTECGGSLWEVFNYYKQKGGINADKLLSYKDQSCKEILPRDRDFLHLIINCAQNEQSFRDAEDQVFDDLYWSKGLKYFNRYGFKENLSLGVIEDSILHSGSMLSFLTGSFPEKTPINGGDEKKWIEDYLNARLNWLANHSNKILRSTVYRPKFFLNELSKENWDFNCPLSPKGIKIC